MRALSTAAALLALFAAPGCSEANKQNYAYAALGTSAGIAAVGLNRALTKDCWALCSPGYACNQESGLCELGECIPGCEYGWHCVRHPAGALLCEPDPNQARMTSAPAASSPPGTAPQGLVLLDAGFAFDASAASDSGAADASLALDSGL
jgi:hypothetical protein